MEIGDWKATGNLSPLYRRIRELGLEGNIAELEAFGFTVLEGVIDIAVADRLRQRILEVAADEYGMDLDEDDGSSHKGQTQMLHGMLAHGRPFEQAIMEERALLLMTYLLGESCILDSLHAFVKGPEAPALPLHCDSGGIPAPLPPYAQVANTNWLLTDYTADGGAIRFVPGSHKLCRHARPDEIADESRMVPIEAPKGSLVIFHGNTWHGACPKDTPGLRVNLIAYYCRMYIRPQEWYLESLPAEVFERNPPRFARLVGDHLPFTDTRYDLGKLPAVAHVSRSQHN